MQNTKRSGRSMSSKKITRLAPLERNVGIALTASIVLTMQTIYVKMAGAPIGILFNACMLGLGCFLVYLKRKTHIPKSLVQKISISGLLFTNIPVLQILFLRKAINFSALLLIVILFVGFFSVCCICVYHLGIKRILDNVADVMFVITCIGLVLYFTGQVLHIVKPLGRVVYSWGGTHVASSWFFLLFNPQGSPYHAFRNGRYTSIFTEAPMCSFMLCATLITMLFISERKVSYLKIAVISVAIYCTVSTTGYIIALLAAGAYVLTSKSMNAVFRWLFIVVCVPILGYFVIDIYQTKQAADVGSIADRNANFSTGISDFLNSPLFGQGFKSDAIGVAGFNTSVFSNVLQQGGILFFFWYFMPILLAVFIMLGKRQTKYLIATVLYLALIYVSAVTYTGFSILLVSIFLVYTETNTKGGTDAQRVHGLGARQHRGAGLQRR